MTAVAPGVIPVKKDIGISIILNPNMLKLSKNKQPLEDLELMN